MTARTVCELAYVRVVLRGEAFWVESIETGHTLEGVESRDMGLACKVARGSARALDAAMRKLAVSRANDAVLATLLAADLGVVS